MKFYLINIIFFRKFSRLFLLCCLFILIITIAAAQQPVQKNVDKLSPILKAQTQSEQPKGKSLYSIATSDLKQFELVLQQNKTIRLVSVYEPAQLAVIECTRNELEKLILHPVVLFIDTKKKAKEELLFGFVDYAANKISTIQNKFPLYNGNAINISVKEQRFDTTDIDLINRTLPSPVAATTISSHASIMATMMAGGGNSWYNTKGAAWKSNLSSASFQNLFPETNAYYQTASILLQNHSYGTVNENYYGPEATGYDASVNSNTSLLHLISAGNSGTLTPTTGPYAGITGYSNLTGNFKQAKNIITVGHIDSFGIVLSASSKGPAYDGRVKPELVAFGEDGSSGATALVSGVVAVLHQTYKEINSGTIAPASLIKAVLLNSADDVDATGIDFKSGYGNLNAMNAVKTILSSRYFSGTVLNNTQQQFNINLPAGIKQLKLTLVWTDPQATVNAPKALVNDLDLELRHVPTNTIWKPWVLNASAGILFLQQLPVRKRDSLNVAEQITVDHPQPGNYEFIVKGFSVASGTQPFSIAYQIDSVDTFNWHFPTSSDHLFPGITNVLRFESGFATGSGLLEMSTDNGNSWQLITNNADLTKGYYKMFAPATYSKALLRMTVNNQQFTTDTFTISNRINTTVGFNCVDSFLISWNKVAAATGYQIHRLGSLYMEPFLLTTDTFAVISKTASPAKHYAITPLLNNKPAVRTYTFNYELQGTGCYVKSFLVNLNLSNKGDLLLELGTTYLIKAISFEKQIATGFVLLEKKTTIGGLQYQSLDPSIKPGANIYRVVIELTNGKLIASDIAVIYYVGTMPAVIYPNPAQRNESVTVLTQNADELLFQLIDNYGRVVLQTVLKDSPQKIPLNGLSKGIYYYRLLNANKKVYTGSLIIH